MRLTTLLSIATCLSLSAGTVLADTEHPTIASARQSLATYDLDGETTTDVLVDLGNIDRTAYLNELQLARFVRAVAATDLLVLSRLKSRPAVHGRVARAYGVPARAIVRHVEEELDAVGERFAPELSRDARAAIARLRGIRGRRAEGPRSDAFFVREALTAASSPDPIAGLGALSERELALPFDRSGRRAAATVVDALAAIERIRTEARNGDPFAAELVSTLDEQRERLRALELSPMPVVDESLGLVRARGGQSVRPDLLVSVQSSEIRYAFVPRLSFASGDAALVSEHEPALPAVGRVELGQLPAWPRAIETLVAALEPAIDADTLIAVGGAPDAEAHLLTRAWQSVARAGGSPQWLVAAGPNGELVGVRAQASREAQGSTEIFVRLGGHSISRRGARSLSLPRQRTDAGWRFDWEGLAQTVEGPAALRYMGVVSLQTVMTTALTVGDEVTLDFP